MLSQSPSPNVIAPATTEPTFALPPPATPPSSPAIREFLAEFVAYFQAENDPHHATNKIGCLKKYFGSDLLGCADGKPAVFSGQTLADVDVSEIARLLDALPAAKKTKRHHRNAFHSLYEYAMKRGHYTPTNFRYPNPMAALPTYHEKNKQIIYLTQAEIDNLLEILAVCPPVQIAAALMIYGGLRRAEALWLTKKDIAADFRFFSVVNKIDDEKDLESSLKTGERSVPILPPLKALLEPYVKTLRSKWLCPSPRGKQWIGENFGDKHRELLRAAELRHTCLHYRHTFATQRAAEGWTLFRIAKTMGNSVAVCERYYAAFVDPSLL
jgi:integrase